MQSTGENSIQIKRRIVVSLIIPPLLLGFAALINIVGSPQYQQIRGIDVVRLMAIGFCGGIAAVGFGLLIVAQVRKG